MSANIKYLFSGTLFILAIYILISCNLKGRDQDNESMQDSLTVTEPVLKYGLPVDSFIIKKGKIEPNQHLSSILSNFGVALGTIDKLAKDCKDVFDVRKIRSGHNYTVFHKQDSTETPHYFVYENSVTDYYVFELFDSLKVYRGEKDVKVRQVRTSGTIETSLWNTMIDNNLDPMLALKLSDIFAWTIDFFAIQRGDRFRIIFDELHVDSSFVGIGDIYAVQFDHYGDANYAFRFFQDERYDYFDETGVSLRKAFLKAPLDFYRITSRFSYSRMHPVLRIRRPHLGVDYAAPKGTPVMSIGDGVVIERAFQKGGGGNYVKIKHNSVYTTVYMHLSGFGKGITTGTRVKQKQVIGYVGSTGLSTGPHLDFRVFKNGKPIDPLKVEAPPVEPVSQENIPAYNMIKDSLLTELHKISWNEMLAVTE
jgi:murein DD-endopeptidase MepM/ murein hydrolase activator NlpD